MDKLKSKSLRIFGFLVMLLMVCLAGILPTDSVKAANIKNKTFKIYSDHPVSITVSAVEYNGSVVKTKIQFILNELLSR